VTAKKPPKRGGRRNAGMLMPTNTSGLSGIWFQKKESTREPSGWLVYVCCAWMDREGKARRTAYSVRRYGTGGALMCAMAVRVKAGLPVPDMAEAMVAIEKFLQEVGDKPKAATKAAKTKSTK
jgi:hypothetical protein